MARKASTQPTDAELAILKVLWNRGPSSVRAVHDALGARRGTGYTTTLKQLQVMADKGLVARDETGRSHVYRARMSETRALRELAASLLGRAFDGSVHKLVMHALAARRAAPEELAEIRALLDELERKGKGHVGDP